MVRGSLLHTLVLLPFPLHMHSSFLLKNILHVPKITKNLIFVQKFTRDTDTFTGPQRNSFTKVRVSMVFMRSPRPPPPPVHLLSLVNVLPLIVGIPDWDIQPSKSCLGFSPNLVFQLLGTIMDLCLVLLVSLQKANS